MEQSKLKGKDTFTVKEDHEIKKLLAIIRAVSKERQIGIKETLRIYHGFNPKGIQGRAKVMTLDEYERLKQIGLIKICS